MYLNQTNILPHLVNVAYIAITITIEHMMIYLHVLNKILYNHKLILNPGYMKHAGIDCNTFL